MSTKEKALYFDSIADRWDGFIEDREKFFSELKIGINSFRIKPDSIIVDVGCGTGNLTLALLEHLSESGRIYAIDISKKMIEQAKKKIKDERVKWLIESAESLSLENESCDFVIFYSVWPHIEDKQKTISEAKRVLKNCGKLIIWHNQSRNRINEIHHSIDAVINKDTLMPVDEEKLAIHKMGFNILISEEDDRHYLIIAEKL